MIAICRATSRNVKRWQNGDMCLRWTAAGMLEAEQQFRKIIGYKHLAALAVAVEADIAAGRAATSRPTTSPTNIENTTEALATLAPPPDHRTATAKFHGERDNLEEAQALINTYLDGVGLFTWEKRRRWLL